MDELLDYIIRPINGRLVLKCIENRKHNENITLKVMCVDAGIEHNNIHHVLYTIRRSVSCGEVTYMARIRTAKNLATLAGVSLSDILVSDKR